MSSTHQRVSFKKISYGMSMLIRTNPSIEEEDTTCARWGKVEDTFSGVCQQQEIE
jgi:hypothetical protein